MRTSCDVLLFHLSAYLQLHSFIRVFGAYFVCTFSLTHAAFCIGHGSFVAYSHSFHFPLPARASPSPLISVSPLPWDTWHRPIDFFFLRSLLPNPCSAVAGLLSCFGLHACMPACLHACMPACLHACMPACLHACMPACLHRQRRRDVRRVVVR